MKAKGAVPAPAMVSNKSEDRWRIEDDLRTLQRAAEVKADAKRMKAAMQLHEQQRRGLASITGDTPHRSAKSSHRQRLNNRRI
jgi:cell division protein FtsN